MAFHDIRFPVDIAYGSSGGPGYATDIITTVSGHEQRNANWAAARARYNVAHGVKTEAQLQVLIAFFRARKGRAYGFRFKDWSDYQAVAELLGEGDGEQTDFPLAKHYISGSQQEVRTITRPVASSLRVLLDDVEQTSGYTLDDATGTLIFASAPAAGVVVRADFEFDVPVRFDTDQLSARLDDYGVYSWGEIPLIEIREQAEA